MKGPLRIKSNQELLFSETQRFRQWWVWLPVIGGAGIAWWAFVQQIIFGSPFGSHPAPNILVWVIFIIIGIGLPWLFISLKMITQVKFDRVVVRFIPLRTRTIYFHEIKSHTVRKYCPLREYGGWGIRWFPGSGMAYNVSGNKGVELELADGKKLLIGSQKADELARSPRRWLSGT